MTGGMGNVETATGRMAAGMGNVETASGKMAAGMQDHAKTAYMGMSELEMGIMSVTMRIMNLTMAVGLIAAPFALAANSSIGYLAQIETSSLGIAAAYMAGGKYIDNTTGKALEGQQAMKAAQADTAQVMDQLKVANMQTIATLDQLVRAYQETLPVAMAKGFNRDQVMQFTQAMVQAAGAIGLPFDQMGEETRSLLTGSINPRNSRIATVLGLRNEDIAPLEGNATALFDFLMGKLDAYRIAGIESQKTWAGLTSNLKDIAGQSGGMAFEGLFEAVKYELTEITNKIVTIDEKTKTITWNPEFLSFIENIKLAVDSVIAEVYRLNMLLDKAGGTKTSIDMLGAGVGSGLGISKQEHPFLAMVFGSKEEFEAAAKKNIEYADRYLASDKALQTMANREAGLDASGNPLKKSAGNNSYNSNPHKSEDDAAAKQKLAEEQAKYDKQYLDSEAALKHQYLENAKSVDNAALKDRLAQLQYEKDMGLKTTQEYLDAKYAMERVAWQKELDTANEQAKASYLVYAAVSKNPGADAIMQNKAEQEYVKTLGEAFKIKEKMDAATTQKPRDEAKNADVEYWNSVNANWHEGKKSIDEVESAIKAVFALGKNGDESPLHFFAEDVRKATLAFSQAGDSFGVTAEAYVSTIEEAVAKLTGISLKDLTASNNTLAASQIGVDMTTGQVTDPYANQTAMMEDRYKKEFALIDERTDRIKAAMAAELDLGPPNLAVYATLQKQMAGETTKRTLTENEQTIAQAKLDDESYRGRLSAASQYTGMAGQLFGELAGAQDQSSRAGFESAKAYNLAAVIMNTASAIMAQLSTPGPVGWAGATLAGLTGIIEYTKVANTTFGGGGSVSTAPGSPGSSGGSGGAAGSGIGARVTSIQDQQTGAQLDVIADRMGSASLAMGKAAGSLYDISKSFTDPQGKAALSGAPGVNAPLASKAITWSSVGESLFGGGWRPTGSGFNMGLSGGNVTGSEYLDSTKKGGLFQSDSHYTEITAMDAGFRAALQFEVTSMVGDIRKNAIAMGFNGTSFDSSVSGVSVKDARIATAGRSQEDIAKDVQAQQLLYANTIAALIPGLEQFRLYGEDISATVQRLGGAIRDVNDQFALVGKTLIISSNEGANAAFKLQDAFGGAEAMATAMDDYFTAMYTDTEQAAMNAAAATRTVNTGFAEMGLQVPKTNAEFNALRNSVTDPALFAALTLLGPTFAEITKRATELADTNDNLTVTLLDLQGKSVESLALKRKLETAEMDASTLAIQNQIYALTDQKIATDAAAAAAAAAAAFNADITTRLLNVTGQTQLASLITLQTSQEKELSAAKLAGMDTTFLVELQTLEMADAMKTAANTISAATQKILDAAKSALTDSISVTQSILQTKVTLLTGPAANLSPEAAYNQAKARFEGADVNTVSALTTAFIDASKNYNGSGTAYKTDYQAGLDKLDSFAGVKGDLTQTEQQLALLDKIAKAVGDNNGVLVQQLSLTWEALQIDTGAASSSLSTAYSALSTMLATPLTLADDNAASSAQTKISLLQGVLNTGVSGSAAAVITNQIGILQAAVDGTISADAAQAAIYTSYVTVQGALDGTINGDTAMAAINAQGLTIQNTLNCTINGTTAGDLIAAQAVLVQAAVSGAIDGATAVTALGLQADLINNTLNGTINGPDVANVISGQAGIAVLALSGAIDGPTAWTEIDTQAKIVRGALSGSIDGTVASAAIGIQSGYINAAVIGLQTAVGSNINTTVSPTLAAGVGNLQTAVETGIATEISGTLATGRGNLQTAVGAGITTTVSPTLGTGVSNLQTAVGTGITTTVSPTLATGRTNLQGAISTAIITDISTSLATGRNNLQTSVGTGIISTVSPTLGTGVSNLQTAVGTGITTTVSPTLGTGVSNLQTAVGTAITTTVSSTLATGRGNLQSAVGTGITTAISTTFADGRAAVQTALNTGLTGVTTTGITGSTGYGGIVTALNTGINISTATANIAGSTGFGGITTALNTGLNGPTNSVSANLITFNKALADSATATQTGLTKFVNALAIVSNYTSQQTAAQAALSSLRDQYTSGAITGDQYTAQTAAALAPINATIAAGTAVGLTTLTAPRDVNTEMRVHANNIIGRLGEFVLSYGNPRTGDPNVYVPYSAATAKYDLNRDGVLNLADQNLWASIGNGSLSWSSLGMPAFATGGDHLGGYRIVGERGIELEATGPSRIFNADQTRNIFRNGSADNKEPVAELKEQNRLLRELLAEAKAGVRVAQAVGTETIAIGKRQERNGKDLANSARLAA
jgi:hypothetical protein